MHNNAPTRASGTVSIITSGSLKLSNCAERTRYIKTRASTNAKKRLDVLSTKSFDCPDKAVEKLSGSRTLCAILSISSIPCPKVYPCARDAETVAATKRLYRYSCGGMLLSSIFMRLSRGIRSPVSFLTKMFAMSSGLFLSLWFISLNIWYCLPFLMK